MVEDAVILFELQIFVVTTSPIEPSTFSEAAVSASSCWWSRENTRKCVTLAGIKR